MYIYIHIYIFICIFSFLFFLASIDRSRRNPLNDSTNTSTRHFKLKEFKPMINLYYSCALLLS